MFNGPMIATLILGPSLGIEPSLSRYKGDVMPVDQEGSNLERSVGIEPTLETWRAPGLPLSEPRNWGGRRESNSLFRLEAGCHYRSATPAQKLFVCRSARCRMTFGSGRFFSAGVLRFFLMKLQRVLGIKYLVALGAFELICHGVPPLRKYNTRIQLSPYRTLVELTGVCVAHLARTLHLHNHGSIWIP